MPRGFAEIYLEQPKADMFFCVESMLALRGFSLEHPNNLFVHIWDVQGNMIQLHKSEALTHFNAGSVIVFWNETCDSISIVSEGNRIILFLDGFDAKDTKNLFELFTAFTLSDNKYNIDGLLFDRWEISEGIDWAEYLKNKQFNEELIAEKLENTFTGVITNCKTIAFNESNAYIIIKGTNGTYECFEFMLKHTA